MSEIPQVRPTTAFNVFFTQERWAAVSYIPRYEAPPDELQAPTVTFQTQTSGDDPRLAQWKKKNERRLELVEKSLTRRLAVAERRELSSLTKSVFREMSEIVVESQEPLRELEKAARKLGFVPSR